MKPFRDIYASAKSKLAGCRASAECWFAGIRQRLKKSSEVIRHGIVSIRNDVSVRFANFSSNHPGISMRLRELGNRARNCYHESIRMISSLICKISSRYDGLIWLDSVNKYLQDRGIRLNVRAPWFKRVLGCAIPGVFFLFLILMFPSCDTEPKDDATASVAKKISTRIKTDINLSKSELAYFGNLDRVRHYEDKLRDRPALLNQFRLTIFAYSCSTGNITVARYLLGLMQDANVELVASLYDTMFGTYTGLCVAAKYNQIDMVKFLLSQNADPNAQIIFSDITDDETKDMVGTDVFFDKAINAYDNDWQFDALSVALRYAHVEIARELIGHGAKVEHRHLCAAIASGDAKCVDYILSEKVGIDRSELLDLMMMTLRKCPSGMFAMLNLIFDKTPITINEKFDYGARRNITPLAYVFDIYSQEESFYSVVKYLVDRGADVNVPYNGGSIYYAISEEKEEKVSITCLLGEAIIHRETAVAKLLLEHKAVMPIELHNALLEMEYSDANGITGFNWLFGVGVRVFVNPVLNIGDNWISKVIKSGDMPLLKLCLANKGDLNVISADGFTILDFAQNLKQSKIAAILEKDGVMTAAQIRAQKGDL